MNVVELAILLIMRNSIIRKLRDEFYDFNSKGNAFPIEVFPKFYQELFESLNKTHGFSVDYLAAGLIFTIGTSIGNSIKLKHKANWIAQPSFYCVIVGDPGDGKTHALSYMLKPLKEIDYLLYTQYKSELAELSNNDNFSNSAKPELLQYLSNNATVEASMEMLSKNPKGIGIAVDELRTFLNGLNMYKQGNDEELFLSTFSYEQIKISRVTKHTILIPNPNINIIGSIQPRMIQSTFTGNRLVNGFIDRFIFFWPEDIKRIEWNNLEMPQETTEKYKRKIKSLIEFSDSLENPIHLILPEQVRKKLHHWRNSKSYDYDFPYEAGAVAKLEDYVLRLTIVLHVASYERENNFPLEIHEETINGAIKLYDYFKENAHRVYDQFSTDLIDNLSEKQRRLYDLLPDAFKTNEGVELSVEYKLLSRRSFFRFLKDKNLFKKINHGEYAKTQI